jgi:hypothetical protein
MKGFGGKNGQEEVRQHKELFDETPAITAGVFLLISKA